ncbi:MAG: LLM class flavin-dependent oxidoreductase [Nitrososphaerota archaeon]|nr:LLM class flavin-dependent oxidoreductase [Nitrososphaerota archaeon]
MASKRRVDISLSSFTPVDAATNCARLAEAGGFSGVWLPEHYGEGRDSIVLLAAMASATSRITLGTAVTNPYGRHPFLIANAIGTLDELSGGRMTLGIGAGNPQRLSEVLNVKQEDSLQTLRRAIAEIRAVWAGGGKPRLGYRLRRPGVPIMIAAMQEGMLRLAGELGDGVIFSKGTSPELVASALKHVEHARKKARRTGARFETAALISCVCNDDEGAAETEAREQTIGWLIRRGRGELLLNSIGAGSDLLVELRRLYSTRGEAQAAEAIPSSILRHFAVYGNAESCLDGVERFRTVGVTVPILSTTLGGQENLIREISERTASVKK